MQHIDSDDIFRDPNASSDEATLRVVERCLVGKSTKRVREPILKRSNQEFAGRLDIVPSSTSSL